MLRMIEVIGSSAAGYSEAVRGAIQALIDAGEKIHFFEVIEQRGAVREGQLKEFQVKVKVAVE
jgi:flavin-binding protein dodecin